MISLALSLLARLWQAKLIIHSEASLKIAVLLLSGLLMNRNGSKRFGHSQSRAEENLTIQPIEISICGPWDGRDVGMKTPKSKFVPQSSSTLWLKTPNPVFCGGCHCEIWALNCAEQFDFFSFEFPLG